MKLCGSVPEVQHELGQVVEDVVEPGEEFEELTLPRQVRHEQLDLAPVIRYENENHHLQLKNHF